MVEWLRIGVYAFMLGFDVILEVGRGIMIILSWCKLFRPAVILSEVID